MKEWPDKRLDDLFRKSAEEIKPEYDPTDWNELSKRLDDEDKSTEIPWWKKAGLGIAIVLLVGSIAGISFYLWTDEAGTAEKSIPPVVTKIDSARYGEKAREIVNDKLSFSAKREENRSLPRSRPKASGVRLRAVQTSSGSGAGAFFNNFSDKEGAYPTLTENENKPNATQLFNEGEEKSGNWDESKIVTQIGEEKLSSIAFSQEAIRRRELKISSKQLKWPDIIFVDSVSVDEEKKETPVSYSKWAIRLGVSPDLSTVGLKNFSSPKTAFGLLVEYGIGSRIFVQSGIVRSLKVYTAAAGDYRLPPGAKQSVYPSSVDGECEVLEVPLNLRYTVFNNERSGWFASGGISSYQMRKENYDYNYDKHYPGVKYGWSGKTGWYWLSHLNASLGYEYKLSKRLSIVAEPYLRLPLKRVGYGKVNLITTGAWLSVRYAPARRK